ncbi:MAG: hypothetical protein NTU61_06485, partial [Candidatus Altiarchaeota archaeon]|nr:hypothetical protein [Candidatus Altiarchaeota archaeon]
APPPPAASWWGGGDPLAQTITVTNDMFIKQVKLIYTQKPAVWTEVRLVECAIGYPDRKKVMAVKRLLPNDIVLDSWTTFQFDNIVYIKEGEQYALIIACPDPSARIRVAELGAWDLPHNRWITSQVYESGVMLQSADANTWTPLQSEDLTMVLERFDFQTSSVVSLGSINVNDATDLMLLTGVDRYPDTSVSFRAVLVNRNNEAYNLSPYAPIEIPKYTGAVTLVGTLTSTNSRYTPLIEGDVMLATGTLEETSTYACRSFPVTGDRLKVYLDILENNPAVITVYYQDGSQNWVQMTRDTNNSNPIGDGWVEMPFVYDNPGVTYTKIKIKMSTTNDTARPYAKNLRAVVVNQ